MQIRWNKRDNKRRQVITNHLVDYPTPSNISYSWSFGLLSGIMLGIQRVTGIFLGIHYTPHVRRAFSSIEHIIRDVNYGWRLRYMHANGASFFFIIVYMHIMRGMYYGSYAKPRGRLWSSGVIIFFRMILTGFRGYVLPYGQMSFWAATVITNLGSALPRIGGSLVEWIWGGFSVDNPRLTRFFSRHYTRPFIRVGLARVHLIRLHDEGVGSGNPLGVEGKEDRIPFYPYFYVKDMFSLLVLLRVYVSVVLYEPNIMGHPDNYIKANPLVTPSHIVPEWYFLIFYAILRSIPYKRRGVIGIVGGIRIRFTRPRLNTSEVRSTKFRGRYKHVYWRFIGITIILGWIGKKQVEYPYVQVGQVCTRFYFGFFLVRVPIVGKLEGMCMKVKE